MDCQFGWSWTGSLMCFLIIYLFQSISEKERKKIYIQERTSGCYKKKAHCGLSSSFAHIAHHNFTPGCKKFLWISVKLQLCTRNSYIFLQLTVDSARSPGSPVMPHILLVSVAFSDNSAKANKNKQKQKPKKAAEFQGLWLLNLRKIFTTLFYNNAIL